MRFVKIKMNPLPAKRYELLQTFHELMDVMRKEKGYLNAYVQMDADNKNTFIFIEEWATQEDVDKYVQSALFSVLRGALKLLTSFSEITFSPVPRTDRMEPIHVVRGQGNVQKAAVTTQYQFIDRNSTLPPLYRG